MGVTSEDEQRAGTPSGARRRDRFAPPMPTSASSSEHEGLRKEVGRVFFIEEGRVSIGNRKIFLEVPRFLGS